MDIIEINKNNSYNNCLNNFPLARAYVPSQRFNKTYPVYKALNIGTIFPELDLRYKKPNIDYKPEQVC